MKAFMRVQYRKLGRYPSVKATWVGTQERYDKLKHKDARTLYCIVQRTLSSN
jgi:hypothetical protein